MTAPRPVHPPVQRQVWRAPQRRRKRRLLPRLFRLTVLTLTLLLFLALGRLFSLVLPGLAQAVVSPFTGSKTLLSVEYLGQSDYPTGCESVTAVMALRQAGVEISVDEFIDFCLPKGEVWEEGGRLVGDDPYQCFIGDPRSSSGFGCFAPALARGLAAAAGEDRVQDLTGQSLARLCRDYIDQGTPVILWATIDMKEPRQGRSWTLADTGETFTWTAGEHCLLLVGYDRDCYYFNDPYQDKGLTAYEKDLVESRYQALGCQALALTG